MMPSPELVSTTPSPGKSPEHGQVKEEAVSALFVSMLGMAVEAGVPTEVGKQAEIGQGLSEPPGSEGDPETALSFPAIQSGTLRQLPRKQAEAKAEETIVSDLPMPVEATVPEAMAPVAGEAEPVMALPIAPEKMAEADVNGRGGLEAPRNPSAAAPAVNTQSASEEPVAAAAQQPVVSTAVDPSTRLVAGQPKGSIKTETVALPGSKELLPTQPVQGKTAPALPQGEPLGTISAMPPDAQGMQPVVLPEDVVEHNNLMARLGAILAKPGSAVREREPIGQVHGISGLSDPALARVDGQPKMVSVPMDMAQQIASTKETVMRLEELSERFEQRLLSMVQRDEKVMRITVEPVSLGRMTVLCRQENDSFSVEIHVQNQMVRELIARQEQDIRRVFGEANVDLGGFDVMLGQRHERRNETAEEGYRPSWGTGRGTAPASPQGTNHETAVESARRRGAVSWVA